jgi:hypothetical protein
MRGKRNYVISAIHFNEERTLIEKVKAQEYRGEGELGAPAVIDRPLLVGLLLNGNRIWSMENNPVKPGNIGTGVHRVYGEEKLFLSTNPMETRGDNLGKLPEF